MTTKMQVTRRTRISDMHAKPQAGMVRGDQRNYYIPQSCIPPPRHDIETGQIISDEECGDE